MVTSKDDLKSVAKFINKYYWPLTLGCVVLIMITFYFHYEGYMRAIRSPQDYCVCNPSFWNYQYIGIKHAGIDYGFVLDLTSNITRNQTYCEYLCEK